MNETLLNCHTLWPFLFVLTSRGFSLSKWPVSVCKRFFPSWPPPNTHTLFFLICHLQWLRDATASVSSVTMLTRTLGLNKRAGRNKVGRQNRLRKESSLHPLIVSPNIPVDFITEACEEISLVCSGKHVKSVCSSFYVSVAAWSVSVGRVEISLRPISSSQWNDGLTFKEKNMLMITR